MDRAKDKVGYEINFNRYFYKYTPMRPLGKIDADLKRAEDEIMKLLGSSGASGVPAPRSAAPAGSSLPKLGDPDLEKLLKDLGGDP